MADEEKGFWSRLLGNNVKEGSEAYLGTQYFGKVYLI
jgi:hypothetical protein